jgi:hypothetical protein
VILVKKHMNDIVTERYTFGDLYRARETSTLTPLAEHVFHRWYFGRIVTIGDSAHKVTSVDCYSLPRHVLTYFVDESHSRPGRHAGNRGGRNVRERTERKPET